VHAKPGTSAYNWHMRWRRQMPMSQASISVNTPHHATRQRQQATWKCPTRPPISSANPTPNQNTIVGRRT